MHRDTGGHTRGLPRLHDDVALGEIELYGEVLIAVAGTDEPLSTAELDRALGLSPEPVGPMGSVSSGPEASPGPPPPRAAPFPPRLPTRIDPPVDGSPPSSTEATAEPPISSYVPAPTVTPPRVLWLG